MLLCWVEKCQLMAGMKLLTLPLDVVSRFWYCRPSRSSEVLSTVATWLAQVLAKYLGRHQESDHKKRKKQGCKMLSKLIQYQTWSSDKIISTSRICLVSVQKLWWLPRMIMTTKNSHDKRLSTQFQKRYPITGPDCKYVQKSGSNQPHQHGVRTGKY